MIAMIAAMDRNRVIGRNNSLPWQLPADKAYFKKLTMGHPVIMGRKTMESIGCPLSGRDNYVLTQRENPTNTGFIFIRSVEALLKLGKEQMVFVIGGEKTYQTFLPYADRIYLTVIEADFAGNAFFPEINLSEWQLISETSGQQDRNNPYRYIFRVYSRFNRKQMK